MAPSDHLREPRENGCLQNVKQNIRHVKIAETHISKPRANPSSQGIHSDRRSWAPRCGFPALGLTASSHQKPWGCSRFPQQLQSTRAHRQARMRSRPACSFCPNPQADNSQRRQPRGKRQPGMMHQGPADLARLVPSMLTNPPPQLCSAHHPAPPAPRRGGNIPYSAVSTRHLSKSQELCQTSATPSSTTSLPLSQDGNGPGSPGGLGTFGKGVLLCKKQGSAFAPSP